MSSYATDGYHDLHGFLREDSEGRGALCARACAHITLHRGLARPSSTSSLSRNDAKSASTLVMKHWMPVFFYLFI